MAKREGKRVWDYAQFRLAKGELPTDSILDGICIFIGGALLLLPGFLSDIIGLLLLIPLTRGIAKLLLFRYISKRIGQGRIVLFRR
ncbi:phage T7 F exclusion suppressor FxsA [compost metagenome]